MDTPIRKVHAYCVVPLWLSRAHQEMHEAGPRFAFLGLLVKREPGMTVLQSLKFQSWSLGSMVLQGLRLRSWSLGSRVR